MDSIQSSSGLLLMTMRTYKVIPLSGPMKLQRGGPSGWRQSTFKYMVRDRELSEGYIHSTLLQVTWHVNSTFTYTQMQLKASRHYMVSCSQLPYNVITINIPITILLKSQLLVGFSGSSTHSLESTPSMVDQKGWNWPIHCLNWATRSTRQPYKITRMQFTG